jgi:hypothetical protein
MAAVEVAVSVIDGLPNSPAKYVLTVTCWRTAMAFAFAGATQRIDWFVRVARHFNIGNPETIVTFGRLELAFKFPNTALYVVAAAVAAVSGRLCAPANAAALVEAWSSLKL